MASRRVPPSSCARRSSHQAVRHGLEGRQPEGPGRLTPCGGEIGLGALQPFEHRLRMVHQQQRLRGELHPAADRLEQRDTGLAFEHVELMGDGRRAVAQRAGDGRQRAPVMQLPQEAKAVDVEHGLPANLRSEAAQAPLGHRAPSPASRRSVGRVPHDLPSTLGALRASGRELRGVKDEIRRNLIAALRAGRDPWPGIVGFDTTVLPQLERALIAGHDVVLLGERGQGKTRLLRSIVGLLDEWTPVIAGSELGEHPYARSRPPPGAGPPSSATSCRSPGGTATSATPRSSPPRTPRWPTSSATSTRSRSPRAARSAIPRPSTTASCPAPTAASWRSTSCRPRRRIQVSLLNVMEERDIQVRGYTLRLPLDVLLVASAEPEDYANRGRIITPLKDRFGAEVRTHYPLELADEVALVDQEATLVAEVPRASPGGRSPGSPGR